MRREPVVGEDDRELVGVAPRQVVEEGRVRVVRRPDVVEPPAVTPVVRVVVAEPVEQVHAPPPAAEEEDDQEAGEEES